MIGLEHKRRPGARPRARAVEGPEPLECDLFGRSDVVETGAGWESWGFQGEHYSGRGRAYFAELNERFVRQMIKAGYKRMEPKRA